MKLVIEGQSIECLTMHVVGTGEKQRLVWRFITPRGEVWRVKPASIPPARNLMNTDANEFVVTSLLWPVAEWAEAVRAAKGKKAGTAATRRFLQVLLHNFDDSIPGVLAPLPNVAGAERHDEGPAPDDKPREIHEGVIASVECLARKGHKEKAPTHEWCAKTVEQIENKLRDSRLMPADHYDDGLALVIKRLALRYNTLIPIARPGTWIEEQIVDAHYRHARRGPEVKMSERSDSYDFQAYLSEFKYIAVHRWPDVELAVPVFWVDDRPIKMNVEDALAFKALKAAETKSSGHTTEKARKAGARKAKVTDKRDRAAIRNEVIRLCDIPSMTLNSACEQVATQAQNGFVGAGKHKHKLRASYNIPQLTRFDVGRIAKADS